MLQVLEPQAEGPRITPYLAHQLERAWAFDAARQERFARVRTEADLVALQDELRRKALAVIGGLPDEKTPLNARVTGTIPMDGYRIEKLVFESLPGLHVTALVYVPDGPVGKKPAVLVACGHSAVGKAYPGYQEIAARLVRRGYVVLCWDPVGQGERSQFWDEARGRSRYNLVCGEHAVLGNFATIAGTSLVRYMVWDGVRAVDYLLTRDDVDAAPDRDHGHERRRLPVPLDRRPRPAHRRGPALLLPDRAAHAHGEPHLRGPGQRPRAGPPGPRLRGDRPPGAPAPRVPATAARVRGRPRLLPDRGHAQDDARGRGLLRALRPRGSHRAQPGLPQAPVLGREPGEGVRLPRPCVRPTGARGPRRGEDASARSPVVHAERAGARGPGRPVADGGDARRGARASVCAAVDRRALSRPRLPGRARLADRGIHRSGAPGRDRLGGGRQRPRRQRDHRPLPAAPRRRARHPPRARAPGGRPARQRPPSPGSRGEDPPRRLARGRGAARGGARGRVVRPARARRDADAVQGGLDRRPHAGARRRGGRLREPSLRRPRQPRRTTPSSSAGRTSSR